MSPTRAERSDVPNVLNILNEQHLINLRLQGKRLATIDVYSCAVASLFAFQLHTILNVIESHRRFTSFFSCAISASWGLRLVWAFVTRTVFLDILAFSFVLRPQ